MNEPVSPMTQITAIVVVIVLIVLGGALVLVTRPEPVSIVINPPLPTATRAPTATPSPILVYVSGAVSQPQATISLPYNSRVADALAAVGGTTADANLDLVNLAGILHDGDQIHVPSHNESVSANTVEALPTRSGGNVVYINSADAAALETLPGIGPVMAQRIIEYRTTNGAFTSLEDLDNVSGIGPATLEDLAPLLSFE